MDHNIIQDVIAGIAFVVGAVLTLFSKIKTNNIQDLKDRVAILEGERNDARIQHLDDIKTHEADSKMHFENAKAIADLQGQVKIYQGLALDTLSETMKNIAATEKEILRTLRVSENTLIANTALVADKVEHVKADLRNK